MSPERIVAVSEEPALLPDLVRVGRSVGADPSDRVVAVLLPGVPGDAADRARAAGAHEVHRLVAPASTDPHVLTSALEEVVRTLAPTLILVGSTKRGRELAGRLAGRLDLPAASGVTALRTEGGALLLDREALSGNAVATERIERRPAVLALLPGTTAPSPSVAPPGPAEDRTVAPVPPLTETVEVRAKAGGQLEIEKADRIVTIGRGLRKKEDLPLIEALARALGAEVGCTRPLAADAGWLSDDHWIGLTGHRVHPKLYVAVGVSGAVQHQVGMRSAQVVVAVNKDPNAPIFAQADYRIVGDLYQIVPALTKVFST